MIITWLNHGLYNAYMYIDPFEKPPQCTRPVSDVVMSSVRSSLDGR